MGCVAAVWQHLAPTQAIVRVLSVRAQSKNKRVLAQQGQQCVQYTGVIEHPSSQHLTNLGNWPCVRLLLDESLLPAGSCHLRATSQHRQSPASLQIRDRCSTSLPNNAVTAFYPSVPVGTRIETYSTWISLTLDSQPPTGPRLSQ